MTLGITAAVMTSAAGLVTSCNDNGSGNNVLLQESTLPFGAPDFSKIKAADYLPAFEAAIKQKREEIAKIVENKDSATFENTIVAFDEAGKQLERVSRIFFALVEADKTPEIGETEKKVMPMLTELENEISFNKLLFERIKQVYDRDFETMQGEDKKLTEEIYKDFVLNGALLNEEQSKRMKEINMKIADSQQQWGDVVPKATNDAVVWVEKKEDLAGVPAGTKALRPV